MRKNESARGNCYPTAFRMLLASHDPSALLCHGIAVQTVKPHVRMGHAWVEFETLGAAFVLDGLYPDMPVPRAVYYRAGKIAPETVARYTREEVLREASDAGNYGPWSPVVAAASHEE